MDKKELFKKALEKNGQDAQLDMVTEELSELLVAVAHWKRGRFGSTNKVAEEMADVYIMLEQLKLMVGIENRFVNSIMDLKLKRLEERLNR